MNTRIEWKHKDTEINRNEEKFSVSGDAHTTLEKHVINVMMGTIRAACVAL